MPFGNGTGPAGLGPMTGRAAGYCAGYSVPGYMNPIPGRAGWQWAAPAVAAGAAYPYGSRWGYGAGAPVAGWGYGPWFGGRGFGRGWGRGWGRGRGGGRRFAPYFW
jgi:hypothetical protein